MKKIFIFLAGILILTSCSADTIINNLIPPVVVIAKDERTMKLMDKNNTYKTITIDHIGSSAWINTYEVGDTLPYQTEGVNKNTDIVDRVENAVDEIIKDIDESLSPKKEKAIKDTTTVEKEDKDEYDEWQKNWENLNK